MFYTEDGNYLHFEFQTTDKREDIKRFLYYDASLFYKEKRKIKTIVVYSSDIDNVETQVDAGTIKYEVDAFYMKNLNGDEKLELLRNKINNKERLTGQDILTLSFIPLMSSKENKGKIEGKAELLVIQLIKKFKKLPNEYIKKIKELPVEKIDIIATEIFDLNSVEDLEKYL